LYTVRNDPKNSDLIVRLYHDICSDLIARSYKGQRENRILMNGRQKSESKDLSKLGAFGLLCHHDMKNVISLSDNFYFRSAYHTVSYVLYCFCIATYINFVNYI